MKHLQHIEYKTQITRYPTEEGMSLEEQMRALLDNEPIDTETAPLIYTARDEGVKAEYDIRTDRFELALDAIESYQKSVIAKRTEIIQNKEQNKTE